MTLTIRAVCSESALKEFITFPWSVYRGDSCWVPPLIHERLRKLDPAQNPFWRCARRELWTAFRGQSPVGTIAGVVDDRRIRALGEAVGTFGFFECADDPEAAALLLETAAGWLRAQGMTRMRGPYSLSTDEECGILVEGFKTRPAVMEGHNPPYYARLVERCGFTPYREMVARLYQFQNGTPLEAQLPEKLRRAAELALRRDDLTIRPLDTRRWESEMTLAWEIYTTALRPLPENVPISLEDFLFLAASLRQVIDPRMALVAEVRGRAVGFALAIPDINEALQKVNGRLGPLEILKLLWHSRRLSRASFKILMMLPDFQGRGIDAALSVMLTRAIWQGKYREVDLSMTGSENEKSNRYQENLGFRVYRRYRIYDKELSA
jgi:GNAT superfamily N-acetyltransferase